MARKKDEQPTKPPSRKEERKRKPEKQKATNGSASDPYLQVNGDHYTSFKQQLASMGLILRDIPGDGNCLFRALNDQLEGHSRNHQQLREETVRFMLEHRDDFEPFVEDDVPFLDHVHQLRQPGTYGGQDALVAFARMRKATIIIHQLKAPLWQIEGGPSGCPQLHLSYHNGEHYSSVRRVGDISESPANICINIATNNVPQPSSSTNKKTSPRQKYEYRAGGVDGRIYEEILQRIAGRTGCKDLSMVRETIEEFSGDEDGAVNYLKNLMLTMDPEEGEGTDGFDPTDANNDHASCGGRNQPVESFGRRKNGLRAMEKPLTNKERKEKNRHEKLLRHQHNRQSSIDCQNDHVADAIVIDAAIIMEKQVLSKDELPPHKRSHSSDNKQPASVKEPSSGSADEVGSTYSSNNWESVQLGDEDRKAKFLRLMGAAKKEHKGRFVIGAAKVSKPHGRSSEEEQRLEETLESQFQHSLADKLQHRDKKHRGLGFEESDTAASQEKSKDESNAQKS